MRIVVGIVIIIALVQCAPPRPIIPDSAGFVSDLHYSAIRAAQKGEEYFQLGRYVESEMEYRIALRQFPNAYNLQESFAVVLAANGQLDAGILELEKLAARFPRSPRYRLKMAELFLKAGEQRFATEQLSIALDLAQSVSDVESMIYIHRLRSMIAFAEGSELEALCYSHEALELSQGRFQQKIEHAKVLLSLNRFGEAYELFPPPTETLDGVKEDDQVMRVRLFAALHANQQDRIDEIQERVKFSDISDPGLLNELELIKRCSHETISKEGDPSKGLGRFDSVRQLQWPVELVQCYLTDQLAQDS